MEERSIQFLAQEISEKEGIYSQYDELVNTLREINAKARHNKNLVLLKNYFYKTFLKEGPGLETRSMIQ